jgi:hypothetical protein
MPKDNPEIPLSEKQKQQEQAIDKQIEDFKQTLKKKSNSEIKEIATQLDVVERKMLLKKIDRELEVVKDTIVKPGDGSADAAAGAAAVTINSSTNTSS